MIDYILNTATRLGGGVVVGLTADQAKDRIQHLKAVGDGFYKILSPIVLKAGEPVKIKDIPKGISENFTIPGESGFSSATETTEDIEELVKSLEARSESLSRAEEEFLERDEQLSVLSDELKERERLLNLREEQLNEREKALADDKPQDKAKQDKKAK